MENYQTLTIRVLEGFIFSVFISVLEDISQKVAVAYWGLELFVILKNRSTHVAEKIQSSKTKCKI